MKKSIQLFVLVCSLVVWVGCGSKKEITEDTATAKAEEVSVETKKAEDRAAKRAQIIKASAEKAEQRKVAAAEKAKLNPTYKDASGKVVYAKAEVDPSYTGGEEEMTKYLKENLKYPQEARDNGVEGTVFVDFVVDGKGRVREVVASDAVGENVDLMLKEESVRVVASMPTWVPARQHGKTVDASFSIPIRFEIID